MPYYYLSYCGTLSHRGDKRDGFGGLLSAMSEGFRTVGKFPRSANVTLRMKDNEVTGGRLPPRATSVGPLARFVAPPAGLRKKLAEKYVATEHAGLIP